MRWVTWIRWDKIFRWGHPTNCASLQSIFLLFSLLSHFFFVFCIWAIQISGKQLWQHYIFCHYWHQEGLMAAGGRGCYIHPEYFWQQIGSPYDSYKIFFWWGGLGSLHIWLILIFKSFFVVCESKSKNTKTWYTIDALGAIFTLFDTFTILVKCFYKTKHLTRSLTR